MHKIDPNYENFMLNEGPYIIDGAPNCYYQGIFEDRSGEYIEFTAYDPDMKSGVASPNHIVDNIAISWQELDQYDFEEEDYDEED